MNPIEEGQNYVVDVDPVISRHTGGKTKIGMFPPLGMTYVAAILREHNIPVQILDPIPQGYSFQDALVYARNFDVIIKRTFGPVFSCRFTPEHLLPKD